MKRFEYFNHVTEDFRLLTAELDKELIRENGEKQKDYVAFNTLESIQDVVVAYCDGAAVGCAAMKKYDDKAFELKRVFVSPRFRNWGLARGMLKELETIAKHRGVESLILETGDVLKAAMRLYESLGYRRIPNYGQYREMKASVCMEKSLKG